MGQRLNLEIVRGDQVIANAYYHWSGYTTSSIHLTNLLLASMKLHESMGLTDISLGYHTLRSTGATLPKGEQTSFIAGLDLPKAELLLIEEDDQPSRNEGLIGLSASAIKSTQDWAEATVKYDLDTKLVNFGAMTEYRNAKDIRDDYELSDEEMNKIPHSAHEFNLCEMTSEELDQLSEICKVAYESKVYMFADADGTYYSMIE